jgi:hypothetical protein
MVAFVSSVWRLAARRLVSEGWYGAGWYAVGSYVPGWSAAGVGPMVPMGLRGHLVHWVQMGLWARWVQTARKGHSVQIALVAHEALRFGRVAEPERVYGVKLRVWAAPEVLRSTPSNSPGNMLKFGFSYLVLHCF